MKKKFRKVALTCSVPIHESLFQKLRRPPAFYLEYKKIAYFISAKLEYRVYRGTGFLSLKTGMLIKGKKESPEKNNCF